MPWWLGVLGTAIGAIATFVISWSALRPKQRRYAGLFIARWTHRAAIAIAVIFCVWVNVSFIFKATPIGRFELWVLMLLNAEVIVVGLIFLFLKIAEKLIDRTAEKRKELVARLEALELKVRIQPSTTQLKLDLSRGEKT